MATFTIDKDVLVRCPYSAVHLVRKSRLQLHMIKCREHCLADDKKICPFNATHCIPEEEFQDHLKTCEDKAPVDKKVFEILKQSSATFRGRTAVPSYTAFKVAQAEDWDEDFNCVNSTDILKENSYRFEKLHSELQSERNSESASQSSDSFEENGTDCTKGGLSDDLKSVNCVGMGRGQAMLKLLDHSGAHDAVCQSKTEHKISVGRGRGFLFSPKGVTCAKENNLGSGDEHSIRSESAQSQNKSQTDSSEINSSSNSESGMEFTMENKNDEKQEVPNVIGIGRGQLLLQHCMKSTDQDSFQKPIGQIQHFRRQREFCQNEHSVGRARQYISSSRIAGKTQLLENPRIAIHREDVWKMSNTPTDKNSTENLKYDIEHLPPCIPGEIRSVPLFCE